MKKYKYIYVLLIFIISLVILTSSFALFKSASSADMNVELADWHVYLLDVDQPENINIISGVTNNTYNLRVKSLSDVSVGYDIVLTNVPDGVQVSLDGEEFVEANNHTITFEEAGEIDVNDETKIRDHVLEFKAPLGTTEVSNVSVNIDVIFKQLV